MAFNKDSGSGLSPEIARLSSQLARDPKSKLFIPLAEEYMKAGMVDDAISVLDEGMTHHPGYMSARVLLGKAHFQMGDLDKAREQFEAVVKAVPDNLFAHKKLGEIFLAQGNAADALKSYRILSLMSPKDEELAGLVSELQAGRIPEQYRPQVSPAEAVEEPAAKPAPTSTPVPAEEFLAEPEEAETAPEPETFEMPIPEMETMEQAGAAQSEEGESDTFDLGEGVPYHGEGDTFDMDAAPEADEENAGGVYELDMDSADIQLDADEAEELGIKTVTSTGPAEMGEDVPFAGEEPSFGMGEVEAPGEEAGSEDSAVFELDTDAGEAPAAGGAPSSEIQDIFASYAGPGEEAAEADEGAGVYEIPDEISGGGIEAFDGAAGEAIPDDMPFDVAGESDETVAEGISFENVPEAEADEVPPFEVAEAGGEIPDESPFSFEPEEEVPAAPIEVSSGVTDFEVAPAFEMMEESAAEESPFEFETGEEAPAPVEVSEGVTDFEVAPAYDMMDEAAVEGSPFMAIEEEEATSEPVFEVPAAEDEEIPEESPFDDFGAGEFEEPEVEAEKPPETPAETREPIKTETLAELYIKQGFYDRAINIYTEMLRERPDDRVLRQKVEELHMLMTMSPPIPAEETSVEAVEAAVEAEPAEMFEQAEVFEPVEAEPEETAQAVPEQQPHAAGTASPDTVEKLEKFLDNIRKRGSQ